MLFGALFSTYIILRIGAPEWPHGELNVWLGTINTFILIGSSVTMVMAWASLKMNDWGKHRLYLIADVRAGAASSSSTSTSSTRTHFAQGEGPWHSTFLAIYFTLTGLHGLHILGGMVVMAVFPRPGREDVEDEPGAVHEPHRVHRACTGTSSTWSGSSCSRCCICCRELSVACIPITADRFEQEASAPT